MLAHKAGHEAHVAAEVIAGDLQGNKELASVLSRDALGRTEFACFVHGAEVD